MITWWGMTQNITVCRSEETIFVNINGSGRVNSLFIKSQSDPVPSWISSALLSLNTVNSILVEVFPWKESCRFRDINARCHSNTGCAKTLRIYTLCIFLVFFLDCLQRCLTKRRLFWMKCYKLEYLSFPLDSDVYFGGWESSQWRRNSFQK